MIKKVKKIMEKDAGFFQTGANDGCRILGFGARDKSPGSSPALRYGAGLRFSADRPEL